MSWRFSLRYICFVFILCKKTVKKQFQRFTPYIQMANKLQSLIKYNNICISRMHNIAVFDFKYGSNQNHIQCNHWTETQTSGRNRNIPQFAVKEFGAFSYFPRQIPLHNFQTWKLRDGVITCSYSRSGWLHHNNILIHSLNIPFS
jgi:hypothetical protein